MLDPTYGGKMKRILEISLSFLLICLSGCATVGGMPENLASVPPGKGLALFSTGAAQTNLSFSTSLALVEGASRKKYDKVIINLDYPFSSNFPNEHGHVRILALPEGDYYLMPSSGNPYFVTTHAPVYRFKVVTGRITYIGNFHLAGNLLSWSGSKFQRDVDYFLKKNPNLSDSRIDVQKVEVASDVSKFPTKGIIWDAP
jgi:hypothetical protein